MTQWTQSNTDDETEKERRRLNWRKKHMFKKAKVEDPSVEVVLKEVSPVDTQSPRRKVLNIRRVVLTGQAKGPKTVELPMAGICDWVYVYSAESIGFGFTTPDMVLPLANGKASVRFIPLQDTFVVGQFSATNPLTVYVIEGTGDPAAFGVGV